MTCLILAIVWFTQHDIFASIQGCVLRGGAVLVRVLVLIDPYAFLLVFIIRIKRKKILGGKRYVRWFWCHFGPNSNKIF